MSFTTTSARRVPACEMLERRRLLSAGDLDPTFDADGLVQSNINGGNDFGYDVVVQNDGKVIVVGIGGMARHNSNGSVDTTFGTNGIASITSFDPQAVALQSDGKIIVGGTQNDINNGTTIARFLPNGKLDTSFSGDGKFETSIVDTLSDLAIQKDGKIVVVGGEVSLVDDDDMRVMRLNFNGTLDTTFGAGSGSTRSGMREVGFGGDDSAQAVTLDYNGTPATNPRYGMIIVAGRSFLGNPTGLFAVARLKTSGDMDTSFSGDGKTSVPFSSSATAEGVVVQSDGKIVLAGISKFNTASGDFALARITAAGLLDTTFGPNGTGRVETNIAGNDAAYDIMLSFGNKLVVGGAAGGNFGLAVYDRNGALDLGFKGNGKATTDFGATERINALARAPGNKFVAAGYYKSSNTTNVAIARYLDVGPTVAISSIDPNASEAGTNTASFRVTRTEALPFSTRVYYGVGGTASGPGTVSSLLQDYTGIPSTAALRYVDIPANATSATVTITPKDDTRVEATETVILTVLPDNAYTLSASKAVTLNIADNDSTPRFNAHINFQPAGSALYAGYLADTGAIYAAQNGLTYGWDANNSANTRDRNNPGAADQRYDTLNHMQLNGANRKWEIAVPNGQYSVHVVVGDASFFDGSYKVNAENTLVVSGTPSSTTRWFEGTVTVNVTDGRLTLTNAAGAVNNKIDYVDITQIATAAVTPSSSMLVRSSKPDTSPAILGSAEILEDLLSAPSGV